MKVLFRTNEQIMIFFMLHLMLCRIITHSQLNRVLQVKYKIFPEIYEKMSKIDVFTQK